MQLGMMNDPRQDAIAEARWAAANGFEFLDLTIEGPGATLEQIDAAELRTVLNETGLGVVGHTAWYLPFASPMAQVRQATVACVAETFDLFASLGTRYVNVHIPMGGDFIPFFPRADSLRWVGECFAQLAERAAPYGLQVMVEHPPDPSIGVDAIKSVLACDARLGFHLDVGHANIGNNALSKLLDAFGPRLVHVHFSDNRGRHDDHMPLGAGRIDWPFTISQLKQHGYDGTITLEVFSSNRQLLLLSAQQTRQLWAEAS